MSNEGKEALKKITTDTDNQTAPAPEELKEHQTPLAKAELIDAKLLRDALERAQRLLGLLERLVEHVGERNAMGEISKEFCKGCKYGKKKACPVPEILKEIGNG